MRKILALVLLAALAGCGGPSASDVQATVGAAVQATAAADEVAKSVAATQAAGACDAAKLGPYADAVEAQIKSFEQQSDLVNSTPRVSLGAPLQRLLDIQSETRKLDTPQCAKDFHERVLAMMQQYQEGFQNFAAQGDDTKTYELTTAAAQKLADLKRDLKTVRAGTIPDAPTPVPTPGSGDVKATPAASSGKGAGQATAISSGERTVLYEIGGSTTKAFVTYMNESGAIEQDEVSLPWTKEFPAGSLRFVSISAQNRTGEGTVSCRITVNKSEVQHAASDAQYGIASCSGSIP